MPVSRTRLVVAVVLSVLLGLLVYAGATLGVRELAGTTAVGDPVDGAVPAQVYNAPDTVPTTSAYGPVGAVSMVFAGNDVITGLSGELRNPWIAISGRSGDYRAIDAPHRPEAVDGAVSVSADGATLAWAWSDGVVVYDALEDRAREVTGGLGADPVVGAFSPDGTHLLVHDGALRVLDLGSGEVVATQEGVAAESARRAAWTPDSTTVTHVVDRRLVSFDWAQGTRTEVPVPLPDDAVLAWQPAGDQLVAMREQRGVNRLEVFDVRAGGRLGEPRDVRPQQLSVERLLGFTSDTHLTVTALSLETGSIERVYRVSAVDSTVTPVMQLADVGSNWVGSRTVAFAAQPLARGSEDYDEPRWPWSDSAKLVASAVLSIFVLGLYLTRRLPRRMRRA